METKTKTTVINEPDPAKNQDREEYESAMMLYDNLTTNINFKTELVREHSNIYLYLQIELLKQSRETLRHMIVTGKFDY